MLCLIYIKPTYTNIYYTLLLQYRYYCCTTTATLLLLLLQLLQTFHTQFKKKFIDKGAALFRADTIYRLDKTFVLNYVNAHQTLQQLDYPPTQLDGAFFESLANTPGVKSTIIQRTLLVHL
jgi:hypothetical protein